MAQVLFLGPNWEAADESQMYFLLKGPVPPCDNGQNIPWPKVSHFVQICPLFAATFKNQPIEDTTSPLESNNLLSCLAVSVS